MKNIYDELIFMGNNILYAVKDGKAGLINGQGKIIAIAFMMMFLIKTQYII